MRNYSCMPPDSEKKIDISVEPPKIYVPACGVLCDIFWWARRDPAPEEPAPKPGKAKDETP
jgi:hypothetical protein